MLIELVTSAKDDDESDWAANSSTTSTNTPTKFKTDLSIISSIKWQTRQLTENEPSDKTSAGWLPFPLLSSLKQTLFSKHQQKDDNMDLSKQEEENELTFKFVRYGNSSMLWTGKNSFKKTKKLASIL